MKKIEKDFHYLTLMANGIMSISREALINVDNPSKAGKRLVRDARDNIETMKNLIEGRLAVMGEHILEHENES